MIGNPIGALLTRDARNVARDPLLLFLLTYGALIAVVARFAGPYIPVDLIGLYLAPAVIIVAAQLGGAILGFSLVEEREQQTWLLFRVVPSGATTFAVYVIAATALIALTTSALCAIVYGRPVVNPGVFAGSLFAAAMGAPLFLLFLGAFASNKIEAMAMYKTGGSVTAVPILIFLMPSAWHWTLWWSPWYWVYLGLLRGYATVDELQAAGIALPLDPSWPYWLIPITMCTGASLLLARRYRTLVQ